MKTRLLTTLWAVCLLTAAQAQTARPTSATTAGPRATIAVTVDGKPLNERAGAPATTRTLDFKATLDAQSRQQNPDLQPDVVIQSAWVNLARGSQRVATQYWKAGEPLTKLTQQAKPGDRYVIEFDLAARRKNGKLIPLSERPVVNIPLR